MGQIFCACAYDIETKTCCVVDADKFHANCYGHSGAVFSMHYLLRQKSHYIMWGGRHVMIDDNLTYFSRTEELLGISTYGDYESFKACNDDLPMKSYYDKIKFIDDNNKLWNRVNVWKKAKDYFNWQNTHSVRYSGYLINHTKRLAVDLADYYMQSRVFDQDGEEMAIDLLPVLTETGGGTCMALFNGISADSTEELAGTWCGDLLQIVEQLSEGFELIQCCFAEIWSRVEYCYSVFGVDEEGYVLKDGSGKRFEAAGLNIGGQRGTLYHIKAEVHEESIKYIGQPRGYLEHNANL